MKRTHQPRLAKRLRNAFTLVEIVIVVTIIGVLTGIAIPRTRYLLDGIAVRAAADEAVTMLELARRTAMARGERVSVDVDSAPARLTIRAGLDTLRARNERAMHGVSFVPSRSPVVYTQIGMGYGVSNMTLVISRGAAVETVTVSRLGRVRR